jgi:hypothetical protein
MLNVDIASQKPVVAQALSELDHALERWVDALAHRPTWVCGEGAESDRAAIRRCCEAYASIRYEMDQDATDAPVCLGVIGVSSELFDLAERVNAAKAKFKAIAAPLQRVRTRIPVKGDDGPTKAVPVLRVILRSLQRSDLNVHAAYRKIPILAASPRLIAYTNARTRAVYRKSVEEISTMLMNYEGPDAARDRARLASLSPRETHLALVRDHYDNVRANVAYHRLDKRGRGRVQIRAELPIVFQRARDLDPPEVRFQARPTEAERPARERLTEIAEEPFLRSLPVYRYVG